MPKWLTIAVRVILVCGLAGSLFVQAWMVPLVAVDLEEAAAPGTIRLWLPVILVLGIATVQLTMVCVWRLLGMASRDTVFTPRALRWVDVIIGAVLVAAVLLFALGTLLAPTDVPPGIVLLIGGAGGLVLGVALLVGVLRVLLVQAAGLRNELDEVI